MGEYEPNDSRNVTGTAQTQDGRWTGQGRQPPNAEGQMDQGQAGQSQGGEGSIQFEPDPQLAAQMGQSEREPGDGPIGRAEQGGQLYASGRSQQAGSSGIADQFDQGAQMAQGGQSVGQSGEGVSGASNQDNDHTSGIGQEQQFDAMGESEMNQSATAGAGQTGWQTADAPGQVRHGQSVVDRDGEHVGTVDSVDGDRIKLTRKDSADGRHHYVSSSQIESCEGDEVRLNCSAGQLQG